MLPNHDLIAGTFGATLSNALLKCKSKSSDAAAPPPKKTKVRIADNSQLPKELPSLENEVAFLPTTAGVGSLGASPLRNPKLPLVMGENGRIVVNLPPRVLDFAIGTDDPLFQQALTAAEQTGDGPPCVRCKRGKKLCGGVGVCVLKSNVFIAKRCGNAGTAPRASHLAPRPSPLDPGTSPLAPGAHRFVLSSPQYPQVPRLPAADARQPRPSNENDARPARR